MSGMFVYALLQIAMLHGQTSGRLSECSDGLKWHRQKNWSSGKCCTVIICEPGYGAVPCQSGTISICRPCNNKNYQDASCPSTSQYCICHVRRECEPGKLIREGDTTRANECSTGIPNGHLKFSPTEAKTLSPKEWNSIFSTHPSTLALPTASLSTTTSLPTPNEFPWEIVQPLVVAVLAVCSVACMVLVVVSCCISKCCRGLRGSSSSREPLHVVINNNCGSKNNEVGHSTIYRVEEDEDGDDGDGDDDDDDDDGGDDGDDDDV